MWNPIIPWHLTSDISFGLQPARFWFSLLGSNAAGWFIIWLSAFFLQRTWPKPEVFPKLAILWTRKKPVKKARRSTRILGDSAPLEWLLIRNIYPRAPLYFVLACIAGSYFFKRILQDDEGAIFIGVVTMILLTISVTVHASITVARAQKSGLLELVAVAPLSNFEMVKTQVAGLRRAFLVPALIITGWLATFYNWPAIPNRIRYHAWNELYPLYYLASFLLMIWAVTYMGIWMGLKEKGPARAFLRTAFLTLFFPWILPIPNLVYWFILGNVARQTVRTEFRELVLKRPQKPPPFPTID